MPASLLLSGPASSGARATPADAAAPGRNRIHLVVESLDAEIDRLRSAGLSFRSEPISGPGGRQILLADTAGNLLEVGVIDSADGPIIVHAMPARPKYLR